MFNSQLIWGMLNFVGLPNTDLYIIQISAATKRGHVLLTHPLAVPAVQIKRFVICEETRCWHSVTDIGAT